MTWFPQKPALTESELVEKFRTTRENRFFEGLYELTRRRIFNVCLRFLRDRDAAADLTHEAFLRAYERFDSLEDGNFTAWACRIAANLSLNRIRDERTRAGLLEQAFPKPAPAGESAEPEQTAIEDIETIRQVLESLPGNQRQALLLKYVDGYSYEEIASITGTPEGHVRSLLQNGRRNFQLRWMTSQTEGKRHGG